MLFGCVFSKATWVLQSNTVYALYKHSFDLQWKQPNCSLPVYLILQYRRPPPVDKSTLVGFLPFFPAPFAFCISELLSVTVAALLEDMMLANDNAGAADGPWSLALSFLPLASPVSILRGGESWADAKPRRVTSEKSFLSPAGGLVDGPALLPRASVERDVNSVPTGNIPRCVMNQTGKWDSNQMQTENCNISISTTSRELPSKEFWNKRKQ